MYLKVNFDGSIRGRSGCASFMIHDLASRLMVVGGIYFYEPLISAMEF